MASDKKEIPFKSVKTDDHKPLAMDDIQKLLETLEKHEVTEFKLERDDEKIWLKRGPREVSNNTYSASYPQQFYAPPVYSNQAFPNQGTNPSVSSQEHSQVTNNSTEASPVTKAVSKNLKEIRSPMVGTFYRRPAVDAEPFVEVGDQIKKGDVLCIIEAMKLMNEIECEYEGKISKILVENAQPVEYNQVLFLVEPN